MMPNRHLGDGNLGSAQKNNNSEEELNRLSALIRRELEVLVIRTVEKSIKPILEPLICRIVKKEVESAKEKISTNMNRNRGNEKQPSESRSLQLRFSSKISQPVMTGEQIKGEKCESIEVALVDVLSKQVVTSGPLASAKVEMVVLKGDFDADEQDWTVEEFNKNIVIDMEGKIINGKMCLNLKEGVGVLDEISFKHSSRWKKTCELRLGARVVDNPNGIRVREAKTECFTLKDRRNCLYKKHHPPALNDDVWRLENIGQDGAFHKRLSGEKVNTAEDFLKLLFLDPERLRDILGKSMHKTRWEGTEKHAQTCLRDGKLYLYCPPGSQEQTGVVFSVVGQLMGLLSECHYDPIDKLPETKKADAHNLVKSAFEHWGNVVSFDNDAYLMNGSSGLSNVPYPPISSKRASSDGEKNLTRQKKTRFNDPQPSVSSPDLIPSTNFREHLGELYMTHHPPSLVDEVWRLEKIAKDEAFHERLTRENVHTVKDFLTLLFLDPARLRNILGTDMSDKMWEVTMDHAQTCILDKKLYLYCSPGSSEKTGVVFSVVGQLMGLLSECHYVPIVKLSETEKADALKLVISAFEHWGDVLSFDEEANLMEGSSGLSSVLYPSISSMRASSDGDKILTSHKNTRLDYLQPSVSSPDIIQSFYSTGGVSNFDDFRLHSIEADLRCNAPLSHPFCDTKSISQALWEDEYSAFFDAHTAFHTHSSNWDSPPNFTTAVDGFLLPRSTPFKALLVSVLKWFAIRRRIVDGRTHVEQVQSCC